jgi:allophanate hydrolase
MTEQPIWITRVEPVPPADGPLQGLRLAVKDNIDVAGVPTTAGCPGAAYVPQRSSPVVQRLVDAGAVVVGKTNLDQFATGLVGTRSPHGACWSVADPERVSGGSSSGSAVAVALGEADIALGTDTAGSGRVPAAFNGIVGIKPTRGLLSTRGSVPACASLDCLSIFARDVATAAAALGVAAAYDPDDPWSRVAPAVPTAGVRGGALVVPLAGQLVFDESEAQAAWDAALAHAAERWELVEVDVAPLLEAADLLYAAWVAERTVAVGDLIAAKPEGLDPTVAAIIAAGGALTAVDVFSAEHRLAELRRAAEPLWSAGEALLMPTAPLHPTQAQVAAEPVAVNQRLGRFTNFVNLMDLCAIAMPARPRSDGLPFGVTLIAPAFADARLTMLAAAWAGERAEAALGGRMRLAVVGAHMSGLELNPQLLGLGATFVRAVRTAPLYRLYALPGDGVRRPGLVRVGDGGAAIAAEVWELDQAALGALLTTVPAPLAIGTVTLENDEQLQGFVCEGYATAGALDVTDFGGWRAYVNGTLASWR